MIDFLIRLLPYIAPALKFADNPNRSYWRVDLIVFTLVVYWCDRAIANLYFHPQGNEKTISDTLERTAPIFPNCRKLALAINAISPGHIKVLK